MCWSSCYSLVSVLPFTPKGCLRSGQLACASMAAPFQVTAFYRQISHGRVEEDSLFCLAVQIHF